MSKERYIIMYTIEIDTPALLVAAARHRFCSVDQEHARENEVLIGPTNFDRAFAELITGLDLPGCTCIDWQCEPDVDHPV